MPRNKGKPTDDILDIPGGESQMDGLPGNDLITDNGEGGNTVKGGAGDDEVVYVHNGGGADRTYMGGSGVDTLTLSFTSAEWLDLAPTLQAEIDSFLDFLSTAINPTGQATGQWQNFDSIGLRVKQFENIRIMVDGSEISPEDDPVDAVDDAHETDDNVVLVAGTVLVNDSVPDLVSSVDLVAGPSKGVLTFNPDGTFSYDPNGEFDDLLKDETEDVIFTYRVTDANGDDDVATVTITVVGTNTPPEAVDDLFGALETGTTILDVLGNDFDADGDAITITGLTQPVEGTVSLVGGAVQFDAGTEFVGLSLGQTATVSFEYTISDGQESDTATATITVIGAGTFDPGTASNSDSGTGANGQVVTASLTSGAFTNDGTADVSIEINFGAVIQPRINVVYIVDVSGSTGQIVSGATVGDVNRDGRANTILDVEIASLMALTDDIQALGYPPENVTLTIVPFASDAGPVETFFFDIPGTDTLIDDALTGLRYGGYTNYVEALLDTATRVGQLETAFGDASNLVYFLSDGRPVPSTGQSLSQVDAAAAQIEAHGAQISAFGIGNNVPQNYLDVVDNTGGSELVTNPNDLTAALLGSPIPESAVVDADVFVFNSDGVQTGAYDLDPGDFTAGPLGLSADLSDVMLLDAFDGDVNQIQLVVQIDSDDNGTADVTLDTFVNVEGVLPESIDIA
ncbi:Ig-like domain-containing protein [Shimia sp. SDUM112013]|uniref:Ig-like domain-containing protein n=1 Tax=Shimia sp. SDUM112013 TaxID=3136160 RepID=UPI0032EAF0F2